MARAPGRGTINLRDEAILERLEHSDFEDEDDQPDPFASDGDEVDLDYIPNRNEEVSSESESSSDNEPDPPITSPIPLSGRGRARGRTISRASSTRGRVSRASTTVGRGRTPRARSHPIRDSRNSAEEQHTWTEKNFPKTIPTLLEPSYFKPDRTNFTKMDYFTQYFDNDLIDLIVEKTNQTYVAKTGKSLLLTNGELKVFIGVMLVHGCIGYPIIKMYWQLKWRIALVADNISRNRFNTIRNSLKFVFDEDISTEMRKLDKLWKVRPLLDKIRQACNKEVKEQHLSIDEMMIPFSGACGIRQYCPGKPNPVGLKAFVMSNTNGTVCDFHVYQGSTTFPEYANTEFKEGEKPVLKLTESLVPGHLVYFDRYFTTEKLIEELKIKGIESTGTLKKNQIPRGARDQQESDKEMAKRGRGCSQVLVRDDENMALTKWFDNKPVILLSSIFGNEKSDICRRYNKKERAYIHIDRPEVIKMYNKNMGGVDLADRQLAVCPTRYRTKKWPVRFFSHMLDLSVTNCWTQYKKDEIEKGTNKKDILQLRFYKMEIGEMLIEENTAPFEMSDSEEEYEVPAKRKRGRPTVPIPSKLRRTQGSSHMPEVTQKQNRCRMGNCNLKTTIKCTSCNVFLCLTFKRNCFQSFHE